MLDVGVPPGTAAARCTGRSPCATRSPVVAFRDPLYIATYLDDRGAVVDERHERIKDIFQPGETRTIELNDGCAGPPFATAQMKIVAAEALLPAPPVAERRRGAQ